jgi:hypothetical protein
VNDKSDREILLAVYQDVATLKEKVLNNCEDVAKMHKDYYGNGDGGTRRVITSLQTQMALVMKLGGGVVTAVLASLAIAIMDLVRY